MSESAQLPTGSTDGLPIAITATDPSSPGTVLHVCAPVEEEVYIWVANNSDAIVPFTLQFVSGSTLVASASVAIPPRSGFYPAYPGIRHTNITLRGVADVADVLIASLNINRTA